MDKEPMARTSLSRFDTPGRDLRPIRGGSQESPEEIADDITRTRAEMSETIDAIEERLRPERLKAEVKESIKQRTVGRAQQAAESASQRAEQAAEQLRSQIGPVQQRALHVTHDLEHRVQERPIPVVLLAAILGVALLVWLVARRGRADNDWRGRLRIGMEVVSHDGRRIGRIKALDTEHFQVARRLARDPRIPYHTVDALSADGVVVLR